MGKLLTVNAGYSAVLLPSAHGYRNFNAGQTNLVTDAEYTALPVQTSNAVTVTTSGLPDPARDATDKSAGAFTAQTQFASSAGGTIALGANSVTGPAAGGAYAAGFLTVANTGATGPKAGSVSRVQLIHKQGAVVSTVPATNGSWFAGAATKFPAGTAPTFTASVGAVDIFDFITFDGGVTWYNTLTVKGLA